MLQFNEKNVLQLMSGVMDPETGMSFLELQRVSEVRQTDNLLSFKLEITPGVMAKKPDIYKAFEQAVVGKLEGIEGVDVRWTLKGGGKQQLGPKLDNIEHVIMVAAGKGGVGKSTVATNLAIAIAKTGKTVGLMDADVYGPSIPTMMGVTRTAQVDNNKIVPVEAHGIKMISMGFFVPEEQAIIWRGPMLHGALTQFFKDVNWGKIDVLVIDMPPGTGDIQLTLVQTAAISGCVIVTTPQDVALKDVTKAYQMCKNPQINIPVLGVVENMAGFVCESCGHVSHIFGEGGGKRFAERYDIPLLGSIPLDKKVVECGDGGTPIAAKYPDSTAGKAYVDIAAKVMEGAARNKRTGKLSIPVSVA